MTEMVGDLLQRKAGIQKLASAGVPQAMRAALVELHALLGQSPSHHRSDTVT